MAVPDDFHHNADGTALNDIEGRPLPAQEHPPVVRDVGSRDDKEAIHRAGSPEEASELKSHEEAMPSEAAQNGVKKIEAVTLAWSKKIACWSPDTVRFTVLRMSARRYS